MKLAIKWIKDLQKHTALHIIHTYVTSYIVNTQQNIFTKESQSHKATLLKRENF